MKNFQCHFQLSVFCLYIYRLSELLLEILVYIVDLKKLISRCLNNFEGFLAAVNWPAGSCSMMNFDMADFLVTSPAVLRL